MHSDTYVICRDCGISLAIIDKDLDDKDGCTYLAVETGHDCCPIIGDQFELDASGESFEERIIRLKKYQEWISEKTKMEATNDHISKDNGE